MRPPVCFRGSSGSPSWRPALTLGSRPPPLWLISSLLPHLLFTFLVLAPTLQAAVCIHVVVVVETPRMLLFS